MDFGSNMGRDKANHTWQLTEKLRPMTVNVRFWRSGVLAYNATYFAGFVGLLTGMKTGGFSITVNSRFDKYFYHDLYEWLNGNHTGQFLAFTTRSAMEQNATYADALARLNNTQLIGPSYIILGGTAAKEGAVITRDGAQSLNLWTLPMSFANNSFFVLEVTPFGAEGIVLTAPPPKKKGVTPTLAVALVFSCKNI